MSLVKLENKENLTIVRLDNGVTNAISPALTEELSKVISSVKKDSAGMVLAGGDKFYSMGFDLPKLLLLDRSDMTEFFYFFNQVVFEILTIPIPTAAAIKAHAIAGGTILLLACDYRVAASGKVLMGLNEVKLGVPAPYLPDLTLRSIAGDVIASEMLYHGEFIDSSDAQSKGIVNAIVPKSDVEDKALEWLTGIAKLPVKAFQAAKANRVEAIAARYENSFREKNEKFLDCWFSPESQELLAEAAKKF